MPKLARTTLALTSSLIAGSAFAGPLDPVFTALGGTSIGLSVTTPRSLSENGQILVGNSNDPLINLGLTSKLSSFRWTADLGLVRLETGTPGTQDADGNGISGDGKVIVGRDSFGRPFRWTAATGAKVLPLPGLVTTGEAKATSFDGSIVVGSYRALLGTLLTTRAFRWTAEGGTVAMGDASVPSTAVSVSADDSAIVGRYGTLAYRWTSAGLVTLGDLAGGIADSEATDVSADGKIVIGRGTSAVGFEAFRWTVSGGMTSLGDLPGGAVNSIARAVTPDGRIIVGTGTNATGQVAMIWDSTYGMRDLKAVLSANGLATALNGWVLTSATDVTVAPSGLTVVTGTGIDPAGKVRSFVASLPLTANFTSLGTLPVGNFVSSARAISPDGSTIVGVSNSPTGNRAFVWNNTQGMFDIGTGALGAFSVSNGGNVVVGQSAAGDAIRWFRTGVAHLGAGTVAKAVSGDGLVIGGCIDKPAATAPHLRSVAFRWTSAGIQTLNTLVGTAPAAAVVVSASADGSVLAGNAMPTTGATTVSRSVLWKADGTQIVLPALAGGTGESETTGISRDGSVVVGWSRGTKGPEAFRWTASGGMVGLGNLPGGNASRALGVSPDGNTIVGLSAINGENHAFIWNAVFGMKDLEDFLADQGLSGKLSGWRIYSACGVTVTPSGVIALTGSGWDPDGRVQSFIATVPAILSALPARP